MLELALQPRFQECHETGWILPEPARAPGSKGSADASRLAALPRLLHQPRPLLRLRLALASTNAGANDLARLHELLRKKFRRPMYRHAASNYGLPGELKRYRPSTPTTARCTEHDPAVVGPVGGGAAAVADNPSLRRNGGCAEVDTGQWHPPRTRLVSSHLRSVQSNKIARRHRTPLANLRPALPAGQDRALVSRA